MDSDFPNELELDRRAQLIDRLITIFDPESQLESAGVRCGVGGWDCMRFLKLFHPRIKSFHRNMSVEVLVVEPGAKRLPAINAGTFAYRRATRCKFRVPRARLSGNWRLGLESEQIRK
jgi:hypothetical protein